MAKPKTSRQKQNTSRQNQKPHSKIKIPHDKIPHRKTKYFTAKANSHSKTKAILPLPWSIWFCCEVFGFAVRYFVFAVRYFCFCREVFGFAMMYFVFGARFLVLPWQLWATVWYQLSMKSPLPRALLNRMKDFFFYLIPVPFVTNLAALLVSCQVTGSAPYGGLQSNGTTFYLFLVFTWRHQNSN